ncbi:MAG: HNH endonuclease [Clostridia bacterium]|nr:HNH endonuclease [Clostridia bacterium]
MVNLLLFIAIFIAITVTVYLLYNHFSNQKRKKYYFVKENSVALKELNVINDSFAFNIIPKIIESHSYDNQIFYESISCKDYLIYQLQFKRYEYINEIKKANYNKKQYTVYSDKISKIESFGKFDSVKNQKQYDALCKIEKKLFEKAILYPVTDFSIKIILSLTNINGYEQYRKSAIFTSDIIYDLIKKVNNRVGAFYADREIWDAICRVERGRVSNKMRFSIYKRDGYRCRLCGTRGSAYNELEIDHIKPIAKGGKSTYDNLQTLCKRCNVEKGDTYYG